MTTKLDTTRRGFLAACGVGAAALAVPGGAAEARGFADPFGGLFSWYRRMIERLAEELRPRFASGELRAPRDVDFEEEDGPARAHQDSTPWRRIEAVIAAPLGIQVDESVPRVYVGDVARAHLVLAASPVTPFVSTDAAHHGFAAQEVARWDVIALARARGYYVPAADEDPIPSAAAREN
jgi:hypothetical protein